MTDQPREQALASELWQSLGCPTDVTLSRGSDGALVMVVRRPRASITGGIVVETFVIEPRRCGGVE